MTNLIDLGPRRSAQGVATFLGDGGFRYSPWYASRQDGAEGRINSISIRRSALPPGVSGVFPISVFGFIVSSVIESVPRIRLSSEADPDRRTVDDLREPSARYAMRSRAEFIAKVHIGTTAISDSSDHLRKARFQYAALPYRWSKLGSIEVLLATSRDTQRWIIPKGWPMKGRTPAVAAAREAYEETGVVGVISPDPLGSYSYNKARGVRLSVEVYSLLVRKQERNWPEKGQRKVKWFEPVDAVAALREPSLKRLIKAFCATHNLPATRGRA